MTDRPALPNHDARLAAIERRLERLASTAPAAALRHRVLMAVDDSLTVPRPIPHADDDSSVPGWVWAAAVVLGIALTAVAIPFAESLRLREGPPLSAQLHAAGMTDDSLHVRAVQKPRPERPVAAVQPAKHALSRRPESRVLELQRLLQEML